MKWNWGTGLTLAFIVFCSLMITMVVKSFQQDFHLVSKDYYQDEIQYQTRIDHIRNAQRLDQKVTMKQVDELLLFTFPESHFLEGKIHLYKPEDAASDKRIKALQKETVVRKKGLRQGLYIAKISWTDANKVVYYQENKIVVN